MMKLAPENLRLTAIYGLIIAASVICFGASVGNWIDKTRRITGKFKLYYCDVYQRSAQYY